MARASSTRFSAIGAGLAAAVLAVGCSGDSAEQVSADSPIRLEASQSQSLVTFENKSGLPLLDVEIVVVPYGPGAFSRRLSRVENTLKRQVPLSEFRGRDGTPLNLRVVRPKAVRVTAKDATGKGYEAEVAWK